MKVRLTDKLIVSLEPPKDGGTYEVWDTEIKSFGIRVGATSKTFIMRWRKKIAGDGARAKSRRPTLVIGQYGQITLKTAREAAQINFGLIAKGVDPKEHRTMSEAEATTVGELCDRYQALDSVKALNTYKGVLAHLEKIRRKWKDRRVCDIAKPDVQRLHQEITAAGFPIEANRLVARISAVWNYAISEGLTLGKNVNPVMGVTRNPPKSRDRHADWDELQRIQKAILTAVRNPTIRVYMLVLHSQKPRCGALRHAKWEDFKTGDFAAPGRESVLTLYKTKNKKPEKLILSRQDSAMIESLPRIAGNPYIFAGKIRGKPINKQNTNWKAVRTAAGVENLWMHDSRRKYADDQLEQGKDIRLISKGLGHSNTGVTEAHYAHAMPRDVREAGLAFSEKVHQNAGFDVVELVNKSQDELTALLAVPEPQSAT